MVKAGNHDPWMHVLAMVKAGDHDPWVYALTMVNVGQDSFVAHFYKNQPFNKILGIGYLVFYLIFNFLTRKILPPWLNTPCFNA